MVVELQYLEEVSVLKIRIKFAKRGYMKFIGHLDTMRYFQKVMRRADVDMVYSEGYNPHQIMSFAAPLGVGLTSEGEYFDIEVHDTESSEVMVKRLNEQMVEGMEVLSYRKLPDDSKNAMSIVAAADYLVSFRKGYEPDIHLVESFEKYMALSSIVVMKKTKKSEKEVDIRSGIYEGKAETDKVFLKLASASGDYLKPELVMSGFYQFLGIPMPEYALEIQRLEVYAQKEEGFVTLESLGEIIL